MLTRDVISKNLFSICFCLDALRTAFRFRDLCMCTWIPKSNRHDNWQKRLQCCCKTIKKVKNIDHTICPIFTMNQTMPPPKQSCPFPWADTCPHLVQARLYPKSHLNFFLIFSTAHSCNQTQRPRYICNNRPCLGIPCLWHGLMKQPLSLNCFQGNKHKKHISNCAALSLYCCYPTTITTGITVYCVGNNFYI